MAGWDDPRPVHYPSMVTFATALGRLGELCLGSTLTSVVLIFALLAFTPFSIFALLFLISVKTYSAVLRLLPLHSVSLFFLFSTRFSLLFALSLSHSLSPSPFLTVWVSALTSSIPSTLSFRRSQPRLCSLNGPTPPCSSCIFESFHSCPTFPSPRQIARFWILFCSILFCWCQRSRSAPASSLPRW